MEAIGIIGNICSILGVFISVFLSYKVLRIENISNNNSKKNTIQENNIVGRDQAGSDIIKNL